MNTKELVEYLNRYLDPILPAEDRRAVRAIQKKLTCADEFAEAITQYANGFATFSDIVRIRNTYRNAGKGNE